jgi:distal antenna
MSQRIASIIFATWSKNQDNDESITVTKIIKWPKPSLTVKNLAKLQQKTSSSDIMRGAMLDKYKKAQAMAQSDLSAGGDDALWYWLKSQQAMMGLNSLYNQSQLPQRSSSPKTSSPHHSMAQHPTPEISSPAPPAASTTPPLGTPDDKNQGESAWFWQWYKTFGELLLGDKEKMVGSGATKEAYENILYSQLTKGTSPSGAMGNGSINNNTINNNFNT